MKNIKWLFLLVFPLFFSCQNSLEKQTYTSGNVQILVDETFTPIIEDQVYIFENTYPKAKLNLVSKPENELLSYFLNDSIQVAILSRKLTQKEAKFYENKKITIRVNHFATDGLALITHQSNPISEIAVSDVLNILQGKPSKIKNLIFDNSNSSTVRYFKEKAGVKDFPKEKVYALSCNADVIQFVYKNPGSIGIVGVNWIGQPDKKLESIVAQLKILGVKNESEKSTSDKYYRPTQTNMALNLYPFTRLLYIINCQGGPGLGVGFASFLAGERGQRIILQSGLLPSSIPSREIIIRK